MKICLAFSLVCFGVCLITMMVRRRDGNDKAATSTASNTLELPPTLIDSLPQLDDTSTELLVFDLTYSAYLDLKQRNANSAVRIERAQRWFVYAIGLVFVAILIYVVSSYPPIFLGDDEGKGETDARARFSNDGSVDVEFDSGHVRHFRVLRDGDTSQLDVEGPASTGKRQSDAISSDARKPAVDGRPSGQPVLKPATLPSTR